MKIKIEDYESEKHEIMIALQMCGVGVDYITTDLILKTLTELKKNKNLDIKSAVKIKRDHQKKWDKYFEENENN